MVGPVALRPQRLQPLGQHLTAAAIQFHQHILSVLVQGTIQPGQHLELDIRRLRRHRLELPCLCGRNRRQPLLNTRRPMIPAPDWCPELRRSVYDYGLVDTTGIPVGTKAGRDRLLSALQDAIERFEPRLARPRVRLIDAQQVRAPQIRFVVEAVLLMDPGREDVVFDTVLEVASGEYDVSESETTAGA